MNVKLVKTRRGCQMAEKEDRYDVLIDGCFFDQLYFNTTGYLGKLPLPNGGRLNIGERGITAYKKEVTRINEEFVRREEKRKQAFSTMTGSKSPLSDCFKEKAADEMWFRIIARISSDELAREDTEINFHNLSEKLFEVENHVSVKIFGKYEKLF